MTFRVKRVYEAASPADGARILVDRLWPRGLTKSAAHLTAWMKEIAPTPSLRKWFGHEHERFPEFSRRYTGELRNNPALAELYELGKRQTVTLLYGARDPEVNHAVVLLSELRRRRSSR